MVKKTVDEKCPHCGARMKIWKHNLSLGLVVTLRRFGQAVKEKGENDIHLQKETEMTKNQYNNFQKLRYFGLVHHVKNGEGVRKAGRWLITRNGWDFLKGKIPMTEYMKTFRNRLYAKSRNNKFIFEIDTAYSQEYFQKEFEFDIYN